LFGVKAEGRGGRAHRVSGGSDEKSAEIERKSRERPPREYLNRFGTETEQGNDVEGTHVIHERELEVLRVHVRRDLGGAVRWDAFGNGGQPRKARVRARGWAPTLSVQI
jgi:hypothetical protein